MPACGKRRVQLAAGVPDGSAVLDSHAYVHFIRCDDVGKHPFYDCTVYAYDGSVSNTTRYMLSGGTTFAPANPAEYVDWAGPCRIVLTAGRTLVCAEPPRPDRVQDDAIWRTHGGCGAFLVCSGGSEDQTCRCFAYDDVDGTTVLEGDITSSDCRQAPAMIDFWCTSDSRKRTFRSRNLVAR
jgi:hypothetical protein